jgi:hypothetical protein
MSTEQLLSKVDEILSKNTLPNRHTYYQLEKFVIGKEPTAQSQLWQIVRELEARRETVDAYQKDLHNAEDNLELFDINIERLDREIRSLVNNNNENTDLDIKEREINIRRTQREKESLICTARKVKQKCESVLEEMVFLANAYDAIVSQYGEMKPLDDEQAQKEMWNEKLLEEFNLRIILQKPFDIELVRTIMCLHDEAPVKQNMSKILQSLQQKLSVQPKATPKANIGR